MRHERLGIVSLLSVFVILTLAATVVNASSELAVAGDPALRPSRACARLPGGRDHGRPDHAGDRGVAGPRPGRAAAGSSRGFGTEGASTPATPDGMFGQTPSQRDSSQAGGAGGAPPTGYLDSAGADLRTAPASPRLPSGSLNEYR